MGHTPFTKVATTLLDFSERSTILARNNGKTDKFSGKVEFLMRI